MSAKYTFLAWDTPIENAPLKLALLQLANNADDDGFSYYSISKMAIACGMSNRTFMRKISDLENMGILTVERRANRPSLYTLIGDEMGVSLCHLQDTEVTESHGRVTESHLLGDRESLDLNNTPETSPVTLFKSEIEAAFKVFYNGGMRKANPKGALKAFTALCNKNKKDNSPMDIANHLVNDIQIRLANKQFGFDKTHPASYLNAEGWKSERIQESNAADNIKSRNTDPMAGVNAAIARREQQRNNKRNEQTGLALENGCRTLPYEMD